MVGDWMVSTTPIDSLRINLAAAQNIGNTTRTPNFEPALNGMILEASVCTAVNPCCLRM